MKKNKSIYNSLESYNGIVIAEFACGHEGDIEKFKNLLNIIFNQVEKTYLDDVIKNNYADKDANNIYIYKEVIYFIIFE